MKKVRNSKIFVMGGAALAALIGTTPSINAQTGSNTIMGIGYAEISEDVAAVKATAAADARQRLMRAMVEDAIGADRIDQVSNATIDALVDQIQPSMILEQSGQRDGARYKWTITANVDRAWITTQLRLKGIDTAAQRGGASERLIFVMLDENNSVGRDYNKPQEIITQYDSFKGASFSDKSVSAYSEKERSAESSRSRSASSASGSASAAYRSRSGAGAARQSGRAASASSSRSSSAYSRSEAAIQKNDVQAEVHDDVHFRQEIRMQKVETKSRPSDYALNAISRELVSYGVEFADAGPSLNSFFAGKRPLWSQLMKDARLEIFQKSLEAKQGGFFMGGNLTVQDTASDDGLFTCTGSLDARVSATSNGRVIAAGSANGSASDINSAERCEVKLAEKLAVKVVQDIGPQIKLYWMDAARTKSTMQAVTAARSGGTYSLVFRSSTLDMDAQADIMDALQNVQGLSSPVLLGNTPNSVTFQVLYEGGFPVNIAIYQKMRHKQRYEKMQSSINGTNVAICLDTCP
jgi:hypothetical protein